VLCADLSSALIECDRTKQYPVQSKKSGKILGCVDCRSCKPGLQPKFLCGTVVGVEDSIGDCEECKVGYHSAKEDVHPCQPCLVLKCSKHEIIVGTCKIDEPDSSHCTGHCKRGYVMNSNRMCEADELHRSATKDSGLSFGEVISIVFGVLLAVAIVIMIGLCWYFKCRTRSNNTEVSFKGSVSLSMQLFWLPLNKPVLLLHSESALIYCKDF
jgi:hypothetical protein